MVVRFSVALGVAVSLALLVLWSALAPSGSGAQPAATPAQATLPLRPAVGAMLPSGAPRQAATATPVAPIPTATVAPTSSPVPQEPTAQPTVAPEPAAPEEESVEEVADIVDEVVEDEPVSDDVAVEPDPTEEVDREPLAWEPELDASWEWAIGTPGGGWMGVVTATVNIRTAPAVEAEVVTETYAGHLVVVYDVVAGSADASTLWYVVGAGEYVAADFVVPFGAPSPEAVFDGHWVDINLSTGYAVAYAGDVPVYAAITMVGKPGFETPTGVHTIFERVASETLDSATVGILEGDPEYYYIEDVRYTQYFADGGFALHSNYWDPAWAFGGASSHGCVNLLERDAAWFWDFLDYGSVVYVHY